MECYLKTKGFDDGSLGCAQAWGKILHLEIFQTTHFQKWLPTNFTDSHESLYCYNVASFKSLLYADSDRDQQQSRITGVLSPKKRHNPKKSV